MSFNFNNACKYLNITDDDSFRWQATLQNFRDPDAFKVTITVKDRELDTLYGTVLLREICWE